MLPTRKSSLARATAILSLMLCGAAPAMAGVVTSSLDDGGAGTLRQQMANANPGETITFDQASTLSTTITLDPAKGPLVVDKDLNIQGIGWSWNTVSAGNACPVFVVSPGVTATIYGLTIRDGVATENYWYSGGGVVAMGNTTLEQVYITGCTAEYGGGIFGYNPDHSTPTTLNIRDSYVSQNSCSNTGGGMRSDSGMLVNIVGSTFYLNTAGYSAGAIDTTSEMKIEGSVISSNRAFDGNGGAIQNNWKLEVNTTDFYGNISHLANGGAIANIYTPYLKIDRCMFEQNQARNGGGIALIGGASMSQMKVTSSTFFRNCTIADWSEGGGAIYGWGLATVSSCTFHHNFINTSDGSGEGGAIHVTAGALNIKDSILSYSQPIFGAASANLSTHGTYTINKAGKVYSDDASWAAFDQVTTSDLGVQDSAQNGGPTYTCALAAGSVAIDAAADGKDYDGNTLSTDQRGLNRPQGAGIDVGAFEFGDMNVDTEPPVVHWETPLETPNAAGWYKTAVTIPFTVTDDKSGVAYVDSTSPYILSTEGVAQYASVKVWDVAGNNAIYYSPDYNIDMTAPTTTHSVNVTTVTLSRTDAISGVKKTYYTVNGVGPVEYNGPFTTPSYAFVDYWSVDNADNVEDARHLEIDARLAVTVTVTNVKGRRGATVKLTATVKQASNGAKLANKVVTFTITGLAVPGNATTNSKGVATLSWQIPSGTAIGTYTLNAVSQGDGTHKPGFGSGTLTVSR